MKAAEEARPRLAQVLGQTEATLHQHHARAQLGETNEFTMGDDTLCLARHRLLAAPGSAGQQGTGAQAGDPRKKE
jgi:hypothetical protein